VSDDWQIGDLALCVDASAARACWGDLPPNKLSHGAIYTVAAILPPTAWEPAVVGLQFFEIEAVETDEFAPAFRCVRFRKIHQLSPEEYEETMTELLTGQPIPAKV
jgi:hypothetical protein